MEWTEDVYYEAAHEKPGGCERAADETSKKKGSQEVDEAADVDELEAGEDEDGEDEEDTTKKADTVPPKSIIQHNARLLMSIGAPPLWYGMRVFAVAGDPPTPLMYLAAYDDGDLKRFEYPDLEANAGMKLLIAANDDDGGVVANEKGLPQAEQLTWYRKSRGEPIPVGVLLGYTVLTWSHSRARPYGHHTLLTEGCFRKSRRVMRDFGPSPHSQCRTASLSAHSDVVTVFITRQAMRKTPLLVFACTA